MENLPTLLGPDGMPISSDTGIGATGLSRRGQLSIADLVGCEDRFQLSEITIKTPDEGLRHPGMFRCLNFLSETVGKIPLTVYRTKTKREDENHAARKALKYEANGWHTSQDWKELVIRHAAYWGNSVSFIQRDEDANPVALIPFHPSASRLVRDEDTGELLFGLFFDGKWYGTKKENVVHIKGFSKNGLWGELFWKYHGLTIGLAQTPRYFAGRYYARGTHPSGYVELPEGLDPDPESEEFQRFVESFKQAAVGLGRSHSVIFLENGGKYNAVGNDAQESEIIGIRAVGDREVCNLMGLDPTVVGLELQGSYKSLDEKTQRELRAVEPWLCRIESELRKKVLTEKQKRNESHYVRFERNAFLNHSVESLAKEVLSGLSLVNEVRHKQGKPAIEGGDCLLVPTNMTTLEMVCEGRNLKPEKPEPEEDDEPEQLPDDEPEETADGDSEANAAALSKQAETLQAARRDADARAYRSVAQIVERRLTADDQIAALRSLPEEKIKARFDASYGYLGEEGEALSIAATGAVMDVIREAADFGEPAVILEPFIEALRNGKS